MIAEFMDPAILGFILVGVMLFAIFVGFPISFTLIFLGFVFGYLGFGKLVFYLMTLQFSMVMTEQTLAAVPLFVLWDYDGTSWINGKIIFSISINVS
jgi:TRAP-type mannitol/chloroaromatic compound transport system permease large subunit